MQYKTNKQRLWSMALVSTCSLGAVGLGASLPASATNRSPIGIDKTVTAGAPLLPGVALGGPLAAAPAGVPTSSLPVVGVSAVSGGYVMVARNGGVFTFGAASFYGSMADQPVQGLMVGDAATPSGHGYWLVAADGGIFAFGDAQFYGSMGGQPLQSPVVGMTPTPSGHGYWLVAADGGIFAFGDAQFYGSMGGQPLQKPVVGMAATPSGHGYWLVAADGGIFAFGDAQFYGSMGGQPLQQPVVGVAATPSGHGYWLVAADGGIFAFGDAQFYGSMGGQPLQQPVVGIAAAPTGLGYWLVAADGGIFAFGDAPFYGSAVGKVVPVGNQPAPEPTRAQIVAVAQGEVGYQGVSNGANKYGPAERWCSDFATWVWGHAGIQISDLPYAGDIACWAAARGQWKSGADNNPQPGDAAIYSNNDVVNGRMSGAQHVGIVVSVDQNGNITTIEGNTGNGRVTLEKPHDPATAGQHGWPANVIGYASPIPLSAALVRWRSPTTSLPSTTRRCRHRPRRISPDRTR